LRDSLVGGVVRGEAVQMRKAAEVGNMTCDIDKRFGELRGKVEGSAEERCESIRRMRAAAQVLRLGISTHERFCSQQPSTKLSTELCNVITCFT
jgi:hypothetical protein